MLFEINEELHRTRHDNRFAMTHLGQAHLAGTGPKGKTCRECVYWGRKLEGGVVPPQYSSTKKTLNQGGCHYSIPGKSSRTFPHYAGACRFFEQHDAPPPVTDPEA